MTDQSRRTALKYALGLAAGAATMTSFLDRAYGQEGEARMELTGGGVLLLERSERLWRARVMGPDGERIDEPDGLVETAEAGVVALSAGRVMDGMVRTASFSQHNQHSDHSQHTQTSARGEDITRTVEPGWRVRPVLEHQRERLIETGALKREPMLRERLDPGELRDLDRPDLRQPGQLPDRGPGRRR